MKNDKKYFIDWLDRISLKIYLIKDSQSNYKRFFQKNIEEKIECFKSSYTFWVRYNYECSLILAITSLVEYGSHDDDLSFQKFLRCFSEYYKDNKQLLINEHINAKPEYINQSNVTEIPDNNDPIEQLRLKKIKDTFERLNIEKDKETLNNYFLQLKTIRDKLYAHYTNYDKNIDITHSDIEEIIDVIIQIFDNYSYILKNTTYCFE